MVAESWFSNWRWNSRKVSAETDREAIGVLAYEVAGLMSKVVSLWNYLSDKEIHELREEIVRSVGVKRLVAEDHDYLMDLAISEILENFRLMAKSVAQLGRKCKDPPFCRFEHFVNDPVGNNLEWFGWQYRLKKMERKVKKMEKFVAVTMQLSQELEVLAELEQTLRRLQANADLDRVKLLDFRKKVMWQRQEVRHLREMSPWIRTYDYIVRLLARSLLTILERIKHVFEINQLPSAQGNSNCKQRDPDCLPRTRSFSVLMQSSIHPSEDILRGFRLVSIGTSGSTSGLAAEKYKINKKQLQPHHQSSSLHGKQSRLKTKRLSHVGPFKECMMTAGDSPILQTCNSTIHGFAESPSSTLGDAALALHYANVIILIEKLASSSCMIDYETRDDLYGMLPTTIRAALKVRLKAYAKPLSTFVYDASLAAEWNLALSQILEWLSPLAHNMIRWQSEHNFERAQEVSSTNVLLVQTLHFADQAKTEAAIMELLVGLNYICRINREHDEKAFPEFSGCRASYSYEPKRASRAYCMVQD
ncbi:unnamed protein product [Dovyalis caffra]|uniref:Uncharacterized protein n=1 Tax=Dovyalis caffra TaxID=77055 RepID=A0AAV1S1G3_9ROSI|nr:unnamed protein product [Dovyalis caffra]